MDSTNVGRLLDLDGTSGKMELDDNGYVRFIPSPDELDRMEHEIAEKVDKAIIAHQPIWSEALENYNTYRATKMMYGEEQVLPLPLAAIAADQIIARTYNTLVMPRPIVSFDPYFNDTYKVTVPLEVPAPPPMPGVSPGMPPQMGGGQMGNGTMPPMGGGAMPGGMPPMGAGMGGAGGTPPPAPAPAAPQTITVAVPTPIDAEELARNLERGMEFKNRERLNFPRLIQEVVFDTTIYGKAHVKVCADKDVYTMFTPKTSGASIDFASFEEMSLQNPERVKWYTLPIWNVLKLTEDDNPDKAEWAEKIPTDPDTFLSRVESGEYHLIKDDGEELAAIVSPVFSEYEQTIRSTQGKSSSEDATAIDLMEIQHDWIVKVNENGETKIKKISLLTTWHNGAKRICCIYRNPYDHQGRTITPCWQMKDSHSDAGTCTVSRLKWHQKVATHAAQSEIKNAFHANNFTYWAVSGSEADDYLSAHPNLRSGEKIPGKEGDEWGAVRIGAEHASMLPLLQWVEGSGQRVSDESTYKQGQAVPGRTAAATVSQILEQGLQQPLMYIRTLNDSFARIIRLYLKTARQYQPLGETLPVVDPKTREIIEIPFRYPIAQSGVDPLDNFRIALTASDEALAKEHDPQQLQMFLQSFQGFANFAAQVAGPMANPGASPATVQLFSQIVEGANLIFKKMASIYRTDEDKFDISNAVEALKKEHDMAQQAMQQQQQQPPQPQIKINLSGQLSPQEVDSAAQNAGIGGVGANPNAQGAAPQPAGPAGGGGMAQPPMHGVPSGPPA